MEPWRGGRREKKGNKAGRDNPLLPEWLLESEQLDNVQVCLIHFKENRKEEKAVETPEW